MNLRQMLDHMRILLGDPNAQEPSDRTLLYLLSRELQTYANQANLSGQHWAVDEYPLNVTSGTAEYQISETAFGKPIDVYTYYPTDPGHIRRDIDFTNLGDVNFDWGYPNNVAAGMAFGSPHTAMRMAFYRKQGYIYVQVQPTPQQSATYKVLYQIGEYGSTTSLDEAPLIPEHHALIELRAAMAALPHARWGDNEEFNTRKREEIALSMQPASGRLERDFKAHLASITGNTGMSVRYAPVPYDL